MAEPPLNVVLPPAGAKPAAEEQLSKDVGILITGCQVEAIASYGIP